MRRNIPVQHIQGRASRQAHVGLPEGTVERELGREGFFGPASHMYHRHAPTGWTSWEGPLRPRAFDLNRLVARAASPFDAQEVLANAALRLRIWAQAESMDHLVRNADGSHNPDEKMDHKDFALGVQVLAATIASLAAAEVAADP